MRPSLSSGNLEMPSEGLPISMEALKPERRNAIGFDGKAIAQLFRMHAFESAQGEQSGAEGRGFFQVGEYDLR
jgi:hypothetical protein